MITIHGPNPDDAKPYEKLPVIENEMVRKTLEKLGEYRYDPESLSKFADCIELDPYVLTNC